MRPGDFSGYLRKFNSLRSQLQPALVEPTLLYAFTRGLTHEFEQDVLYSKADNFDAAVEQALLFDQTKRTGSSSSMSSSLILAENSRHVSFSRSDSLSRSTH